MLLNKQGFVGYRCVCDRMLPELCCRAWARACVGCRRAAGIKVPPIVLNRGGGGDTQGREHARGASTPGARARQGRADLTQSQRELKS